MKNKYNGLYLKIILNFSGDIKLNPRPVNRNQKEIINSKYLLGKDSYSP